MSNIRLTLNLSRKALLVALAFGVAACSKDEEILPGTRLDIRTQEAIEAPHSEPEPAGAPLQLPAPNRVVNWSQRGGGADHNSGHQMLGRDLKLAWSLGIGEGNSRRQRLSTDVILHNGRLFTLDSAARAQATSPDGRLLWRVDLRPVSDRRDDISGGGLAAGDDALIATTGYGEVIALDPAAGTIRWRHKLTAAAGAPALLYGGMVIAISRDNQAVALDQTTGRILWQVSGVSAPAGLFGGASAAAQGQQIFIPFSSGELIALVAKNGLRSWSAPISGRRLELARNFIGDISADPVIDGRRIYTANQAGRLVALDRRSGARIWTAKDGTYRPALPMAGSVFVLTDLEALKRLDAQNGEEIWSVELPRYANPRKMKGPYTYFGPVMAGGRLIIAGSDGLLRSYDPQTGAVLGTLAIPGGGAASAPTIVDGRLYLVAQNGTLLAYQ